MLRFAWALMTISTYTSHTLLNTGKNVRRIDFLPLPSVSGAQPRRHSVLFSVHQRERDDRARHSVRSSHYFPRWFSGSVRLYVRVRVNPIQLHLLFRASAKKIWSNGLRRKREKTPARSAKNADGIYPCPIDNVVWVFLTERKTPTDSCSLHGGINGGYKYIGPE